MSNAKHSVIFSLSKFLWAKISNGIKLGFYFCQLLESTGNLQYISTCTTKHMHVYVCISEHTYNANSVPVLEKKILPAPCIRRRLHFVK